MERIISARVDESVAVLIGTLAQRLHTSKKRVIEEAVKVYSGALGIDAGDVLLTNTAGCWHRSESLAATVAHARKAFNAAYKRARKRHIALMRRGWNIGTHGNVTCTRDELHER